jgi:hypothetical protein
LPEPGYSIRFVLNRFVPSSIRSLVRSLIRSFVRAKQKEEKHEVRESLLKNGNVANIYTSNLPGWRARKDGISPPPKPMLVCVGVGVRICARVCVCVCVCVYVCAYVCPRAQKGTDTGTAKTRHQHHKGYAPLLLYTDGVWPIMFIEGSTLMGVLPAAAAFALAAEQAQTDQGGRVP